MKYWVQEQGPDEEGFFDICLCDSLEVALDVKREYEHDSNEFVYAIRPMIEDGRLYFVVYAIRPIIEDGRLYFGRYRK